LRSQTWAAARARCAAAGGVLATPTNELLTALPTRDERVLLGACGVLGLSSLSGEALGFDPTSVALFPGDATQCVSVTRTTGALSSDVFVDDCAFTVGARAICQFDDAPSGGPASLDLTNSNSAAVHLPLDGGLADLLVSPGVTLALRLFVPANDDDDVTTLLSTPEWSVSYAPLSGVRVRVRSLTTVTLGAPLSRGVWHALALTYENAASGGTMTLSVDGQVVGSARIGDAGADVPARVLGPSTGAFLAVGGTTRGRRVALLDELQLWSRLLPPAELQTRVSTPPAGDDDGLALWLSFDEADGRSVVEDGSGHGLHGRLLNDSRRGPDAVLP
jgi:hypothetical protein